MLHYITDCDDVFKVKWKPEMLRLMNTIISYIGVSREESETIYVSQMWFHETKHVRVRREKCTGCFR